MPHTPTQFFWKCPSGFFVVFYTQMGGAGGGGALWQALLAETVETGTKNHYVIEATHVLRRKLWKD